MLEPFDFRSSFTENTGFLTTWSQRWIILLTAQINSILNAIGIKTLNGDATPTQKLVAGANVTIIDDGIGNHTISAAMSPTTEAVLSINADTTPAQVLANGTYIQIIDNGGGIHTINCTLSPGGPATAPGPYADDTAAAAAGVPMAGLYYLPSGFVVARQV